MPEEPRAPGAPPRLVLAPFGWATGLFLAHAVPGVRDLLPSLKVLDGWLGMGGLFMAATWVAAARAGVLRWPATLDRPVWRCAVAVVLLTACGLWYATRLRATGDEPHYLLMAQSLWRESDLDLRDNLERRDWLEYTPGPVAPHHGNPRHDGRPFPAHSPGLPFALAPLYAVGGRPLCVVALALCGAALAHVASVLARRVGADARGQRVAWVACVGPPAFFYSFHVYTEMPSALLIGVALLLLWDPARGPGRAAMGGLAVCALPWLHLKLMLAAAVLAAVGLWRLGRRERVALLAVLMSAGGLFLGWYQYVFGRPTPFAIYGGMPPEFSEGSPLRATVGLLLDRSFGLLPFAPLFLLALPGLVRLARSAEGRIHLVLLLALVAPVVTWRMWWGGQCPPARFLVPAMPVLAAALALQVTRGRGLVRWTGTLAASGFALAAVAIANPGALLLVNRGDRPTRLWAALSGMHWPIERYLPSLVFGPAEELRVAAVWVLALVAILALHALAARRPWADRAFASGALPILLALAIGVMVDAWARPGSTNEAPADAIDAPD